MATRTKTATARKPASSTARRTTTAKAKAPATGAKPKTVTAPPAPKASQPAKVVAAPAPLASVVAPRAKRVDLLDAVAERSAMKRADVKLAMDLVLDEMGKLLDAGDEIVLPPLGKLTVKKRIARDGGDMLTVKLKRLPASGGAADGKDDGDT